MIPSSVINYQQALIQDKSIQNKETDWASS